MPNEELESETGDIPRTIENENRSIPLRKRISHLHNEPSAQGNISQNVYGQEKENRMNKQLMSQSRKK